MTALLGVFGSDGSPAASDAVVRRMLGAMARRGAARAGLWRQGSAVLAVAREEWEFGPGFSGPVLAVEDGDCVIVADASIYYRADLERRLAAKGVRPAGQTPSHLILAAYRVWGDRCPEQLEGDFAFVLYDRRARRVLAARDHTATRPLFYAELGSALVVASGIDAVLAHPACTRELDLGAVAADAAGLTFTTSDQTAFRDVRRLNAAMTLSCVGGGAARVFRHWAPSLASSGAVSSFDAGAEELRTLLRDAVVERLDADATTSVWLSGGWDSTAVFASGQAALGDPAARARLVPISMTLPADDPWCETDRIEAAGRRWDARIRWLHSEDIPLLVAPESSAHRRAEPWSHEYEQMMRALSGATREAGARVALNGHGGDFLFYVSPVFMADLLARGRLLRLWREWHAMPVRKARAFFEYAVQPLLPGIALRAAARLRGGRRLHGYVESAIPFWFDKSFMQSSGIADRAAAASPRAPRGVSHAQYEAYWTLTRPHFDRVVSTTAEFCLEDGVESRLPLMDRRLIDFAMNRPWWERRSGGEKKRLIRHAMRDLLPAEVLAPRPFKTGSLGGYFGKALHRGLPELLPLAEMPLLAEFGVINQAGFRRAVDAYRRGAARDNRLGVQLLATLQAELWLRARVGRIDSAQALGGVRETAARAAG